MLNLNITLNIARVMLARIAAENPTRTGKLEGISGCAYVETTIDRGRLVASCIIGQMFADLGILRLLTYGVGGISTTCDLTGDGGQAGGIGNEMFWENLAPFGVTATHDAQKFMGILQGLQDNGTAWGEAYKVAVQQFLEVKGVVVLTANDLFANLANNEEFGELAYGDSED